MSGLLAVEILSAQHTYPNGTQALLPLDLTLQEGEFVTVLGPSGCGKSTLLKMVAGMLQPTGGRVLLWNKPGHEFEAGGHRLSFVFQDPTLMPWADVQTNVRLPLDLVGMPRAESQPRVSEALERVGLSQFARFRPQELSGGMQMRVSIARGLVTQPNLLLMDEPFGALDEITRSRLDDDLLRLWRQQNLSVLFVTHSIAEAVYLSQRVVVMAARPGRIIEQVIINEPFPRVPDFRVSQRFAEYAKNLQDILLRGSHPTDL